MSSTSGSMSLEFSGQITRSGCGRSSGCDVRGEPLGLGHVVAQHRLALAEEVHARRRDVALDHGRGHRRRPVEVLPLRGERHEPAGGADHGDADESGHRRARPAPHGPGVREQRPDECDRERDRRRATEGGVRRERRGGLAEREPPPREPAERHAVADRLGEHPHRRHGQRPEPQARGGRDARAHQSHEQRERPGQRHPGVVADDAHPGEVQQEERRARPGSPATARGAPGRRASSASSRARAGGASQTRSKGGNDSTSSAPPPTEPRTRQRSRGGCPVGASGMRPGY